MAFDYAIDNNFQNIFFMENSYSLWSQHFPRLQLLLVHHQLLSGVGNVLMTAVLKQVCYAVLAVYR